MKTLRLQHIKGTPQRATGAAVLITTIGLVVAACGSGSNVAQERAVTNDPIPAFTFALASAPVSLDITKDYSGPSMQVQTLFTEPLERLSSGGELTSHLAESVSVPDPLTLEYTIRSNVHFSDGTALTPKDVIWSLRHVANASAGAQTSGELQSLADIEQTGPMQVTVKLSHPDPVARQSIALVGLIQQAKFAEENAEELGTAQAVPVGTGPYRVQNYSSSRVELARNNEYWSAKPAVENLNFDVISDSNTTQLAMRSGDIQAADVADIRKQSQWKQINGAATFEVPLLQLEYLSFDTRVSPFDDIHVRRAVAYSIDRKGIAEAAFGDDSTILNGMATPSMLAGVAGSTADAQAFLDQLPGVQFDSTSAAEELALSAHSGGFTVEVPYIDNVNWMKLTVLNLQQNLAPLGVTVLPKPITPTQWRSDLFAHKTSGIGFVANAASTPDPQIVGSIVGEDNAVPQKFNLANWSTALVEEKLPVLNQSTSPDDRWQAAKSILSEIDSQLPYLPLFNPNLVYAVAGGFTFDRDVTFFDLVNGSWIAAVKATV
ncbi:ABC transporter substrate-binding protein [Rhodococcus qingshengii]|uniref:ABC transporter substrate-binding protein n=1 Tax=Rhodococcus qingshengii TaxID=334542 RepID=UPI0036DB9EBB